MREKNERADERKVKQLEASKTQRKREKGITKENK